jgi:hypothetical protein
MKHKQKVKIARKMLTKEERKTKRTNVVLRKDPQGVEHKHELRYTAKTPPFQSQAWNERQLKIAQRVERKIAKEKERKAKKEVIK